MTCRASPGGLPAAKTSYALIFGCIPLRVATEAARQVLGTAVISGMLAATVLGVFFIPALFVAVERLISRKKHETAHAAVAAPAPHSKAAE